MARPSKIDYNNQNLINALQGAEQIMADICNDEEEMDDIQLRKLLHFKSLDLLHKNVFYLYSVYGATHTAQLLGCSRRYVYKLRNDIISKINR